MERPGSCNFIREDARAGKDKEGCPMEDGIASEEPFPVFTEDVQQTGLNNQFNVCVGRGGRRYGKRGEVMILGFPVLSDLKVVCYFGGRE